MLHLFTLHCASALCANQENIKTTYFMLIMMNQEDNLINVSNVVFPGDLLA